MRTFTYNRGSSNLPVLRQTGRLRFDHRDLKRVAARRVTLDLPTKQNPRMSSSHPATATESSVESTGGGQTPAARRSRPEDVLHRIANGESDAVHDCLQRYGNFLWSLAKRYCGESEAEDAVQEIFVELWRTAERFDPSKASEMTFVALIARRRLIDRRRRGGNVPDLLSIDDSSCEVAEQNSADVVEISDEAAKAGECLKKLSDKQRTVLSLSIDQAQPHTAIAEHLKMPLGTVKSYARRGLLQLRECMQRPLSVEAT